MMLMLMLRRTRGLQGISQCTGGWISSFVNRYQKQQEKHRQSKDEKHLAMPAAGVPPYYSSYWLAPMVWWTVVPPVTQECRDHRTNDASARRTCQQFRSQEHSSGRLYLPLKDWWYSTPVAGYHMVMCWYNDAFTLCMFTPDDNEYLKYKRI